MPISVDARSPDFSHRPTVLAVDRNRSNLAALCRRLRHDYRVHAACDATGALTLVRSLGAIDVLILNPNVGGMHWTEFLCCVSELLCDSDQMVKIVLGCDGASSRPSHGSNIGRVDLFYPDGSSPQLIHEQVNRLVAMKRPERRSSSRLSWARAAAAPIVEIDSVPMRATSISERGLFLAQHPPLPAGSIIPARILLPSGVSLSSQIKAVRNDPLHGGVAFSFHELPADAATHLRHFTKSVLSDDAVAKTHSLFPTLKTEQLVVLDDHSKIVDILSRAVSAGIDISLWLRHQQLPTVCRLAAYREAEGELTTRGKSLASLLKLSEPLFASLHLGGTTYSFLTMALDIRPDGLEAVLVGPRALFHADKRRAQRQRSNLSDWRLDLLSSNGDEPSAFSLIAKSAAGLSFLADASTSFAPGQTLKGVRLRRRGDVVFEGVAEVRDVSPLPGELPSVCVGIEFGPQRVKPAQLDVTATLEALLADAAPSARSCASAHHPHVVRFDSAPGEEIVGLLDSSHPGAAVPMVVVLPPAYGKTKEHLIGLAQTLCETFRAYDEPLVTLRYDGVRRRGESHHDPGCEAAHNQMLLATLGQGAVDLRAAVAYAENNPLFSPRAIALVTFSLSSVEARLLLRDEAVRGRLAYWIPCMGVADLPELLVRVSGGIDRVENHRLGIPMGIVPMLGCRVDADRFLQDACDEDLTHRGRAQADFAAIDIPITWIHGADDHWVEPAEVEALMGVKAPAPREIVRVPLGHTACNSAEAMAMFGCIAHLLMNTLCHKRVPPVLPSTDELNAARAIERDRLPDARPACLVTYWRDYLLGTDTSRLGFDVMQFSDDYRDLMAKQLALLELKDALRVADLGAGTGNFSLFLLEHAPHLPSELLLCDLVPDALSRAKSNIDAVIRSRRVPTAIDYRAVDLEINRYQVVREAIATRWRSIADLVGRLDGVRLGTATAVQNAMSPRLVELLDGAPLTEADESWLNTTLGPAARDLVMDLSCAAQVVRGSRPADSAVYKVIALPKDAQANTRLPFPEATFDRVILSLALSYLREPQRTLGEIKKTIRPGGLIVVSSMAPDADFSGAFRNIINKIETASPADLPNGWSREQALEAARQLLNSASTLSDYEEYGVFEFFSESRLRELLEQSGFQDIEMDRAFGSRPQAVVARARRGS